MLPVTPGPTGSPPFKDAGLRVHPVSSQQVDTAGLTNMVRRVSAALDKSRRPHAVAAIVVQPVSER